MEKPIRGRDDVKTQDARFARVTMNSDPRSSFRIAVLIPCFNEAQTVQSVVRDFKSVLPAATVYVYDNCSSDETSRLAQEAGARVRREPRAGKGNVVRRMFADIDAEVYLLVDGDGTYEARAAPVMVDKLLTESLDMVVACRSKIYMQAHRTGHGLGNRLFNVLYRASFGDDFQDIFSGYRAFSRRFVKSFPSAATGFEIETELSAHASELRLPIGEIETQYGSRPAGSESKLRTVQDALRILGSMIFLYKASKPARFYGTISVGLASAALLLGAPLISTYLDSGLVPRLPTAVIVMGLLLMSTISLTAGVILDSVARLRTEQKRLAYLAVSRVGRGSQDV